MEILKYKKLKGNIYELTLSDNIKIKLYDDVIIKFNLLLSKKIDDKKLQEIYNYNSSLDAYYYSIKQINKKMKCEKEIFNILKNKDYDSTIIEDTINKLKKNGFLNRDLYVESFINDSVNLSNKGPLKIEKELINLGFDREEFIDYLDNIDFSKKIDIIINKKVKMNHKLSSYMLINQISRDLSNLGYSSDMYCDKIANIRGNDSEIIKKEYNKLLNKYSKKYSGNELNYFIKNKLFQKGFSSESIGEIVNENYL